MFVLVLGIISLATDVVLVSNFARNATTAVIIFSMILISGTIRLVQELRASMTESSNTLCILLFSVSIQFSIVHHAN